MTFRVTFVGRLYNFLIATSINTMLFFRRIDDDAGKQYELGQCAVKCMRTILIGWMQQSAKVSRNVH